MKLRSQTEWKTREDKKRTVRLYKAWRNICGRVQGHNVDGQGNKRWEGIGNEFTSWQQFREWSLAKGFNKQHNSCDRIRSSEGYGPDNCRWISVGDNTRNANEVGAISRAIEAFQSFAPTEAEIAELDYCLGVY